jgi:hypothetical protein
MTLDSSRWAPGKVGHELDRIEVGGVNPWNHSWTRLDKPSIKLPHPAYPHQIHEYCIFRIEAEGRQIEFAAGELSANVWGFYERIA